MRTFKYDGTAKGKANFEVKTKLTDAQAIKLLGGIDGKGFHSDCAFEINKAGGGFKARPNMVAWGFKLAEEKSTPIPTVRLNSMLRDVKCRKPFKGKTKDGFRFNISRCGNRSRHQGKISITNDEAHRDPLNMFYGYAEADGTWQPHRDTPPSIIKLLTKEE